MATRKRSDRDPESEGRRQVVKGGLLAAAAALGFLPGCGSAEDGAPGGGTAGNGGAPPGAPPANPADPFAMPPGGSPITGNAGNLGGSANAPPNMPAAGSTGSAAGSTAPPGSGMAGAEPGTMAPPNMPAQPGMPAMPEPGAMTLPRGMLGKTGVSIPIVGLGTSRMGQRGGTPNAADFEEMLRVFEAAMDMGIEYIDTGAVYGRAEEALGELIPSRRDKIFLVTKLYADTRAEAQMLFERSLQRLKTDHVDLLHMHSAGERNIDTALSQNGSWTYINEQKKAGRTRFVGITTRPTSRACWRPTRSTC
jgi:hypothetical protein